MAHRRRYNFTACEKRSINLMFSNVFIVQCIIFVWQFCAPTYLEDGLEFGASSESNNLLLIRHFHVLQNVYQRTSYHAGQLSNLIQIETLLYLYNPRYIPIKYNIHGHHRHVLALAIEGQHEFCSTFQKTCPKLGLSIYDKEPMAANFGR